jgi:hypothetical protein
MVQWRVGVASGNPETREREKEVREMADSCIDGYPGHTMGGSPYRGTWGTGTWQFSSEGYADDACIRCGIRNDETDEWRQRERRYRLLMEANGQDVDELRARLYGKK